LTNTDKHRDKVYQLNGGQAVSFYQVANAIGQSIGEVVTYIPLTLDQAKRRMEQRNLPAYLIDTFLSVARELRENPEPYLSPVTEEILGKPAKTIANFANNYHMFFK
jgi:NAD(P)H dehydrogenase (quinone)